MGSEGHTRDHFIDALRVVAVLVVVLGHWTATTIVWERGRIAGENALTSIPGAHPATWLLQVMPLLFFVGGFANARALARHDGDDLAFLRTRLRRLLTPTVAFLATWLLVAGVAAPLSLPEPNVVEGTADAAALPFWFLGLYLIVVTVAPLLLRLHRRLGWWVPIGLIAGAAVVDIFVHGLGHDAVGVVNYAFVWLLPHQLGFFYAEGQLRQVAGSRAAAFAAVGLGGLVLAVTVGGYPVSMIGVPGAERWNTDPPSLALVALTVWLLGLVLAARPSIEVWARRATGLVGRLNRVPLTMYLWHISAVGLAAAIAYPMGFPQVETGSARWWLLRPLWLALLAPLLLLLVLAFRRFEVHPTPIDLSHLTRPRTRYAVVGLAVASLALGVLGFGVTGFDHPLTEQGETVLSLSMNPLQNLLHLLAGLLLVQWAFTPSPFLPGGMAVAALYLLLGFAGWSGGLALFAMNAASARFHVALGTLGLAGLALAIAADRRSTARTAARP